MDFATIYIAVGSILAVAFLINPNRSSLGERIFLAGVMLMVWPYFLPIFIYNGYKNYKNRD